MSKFDKEGMENEKEFHKRILDQVKESLDIYCEAATQLATSYNEEARGRARFVMNMLKDLVETDARSLEKFFNKVEKHLE